MARTPSPSSQDTESMTSRGGWTLAPLLTLGLVGWEVGLLALLSGGFGLEARVLAPQLARDAALLLPVWVVALGVLRLLHRLRTPAATWSEQAATLCLLFLVLLVPVTTVRGLLQQRAAPEPADPSSERSVSATAAPSSPDGRFLCAAVSPDVLNAPARASDGSLASAAWAGLQDALLLQVPAYPLTLFLLRRRSRLAASGPLRIPVALLLMVGSLSSWDSDGRPADTSDPGKDCPPGAPVRTYALAAIASDLTLNVLGDHAPSALRYVLEGDGERPGPLVLRANLGECLVLHFTNRTDGPAALRIEGLRATVGGPGADRGFVPASALAPGERLTYAVPLPDAPSAEGLYMLHDPLDGGAREARGLFGALVLEPSGALHHGTGETAVIDVPGGERFREFVLLHHAMSPSEEADVRDARNVPLPVVEEMAGPFRPGAFGINYRSAPRFERKPTSDEEEAPPPSVPTEPLLRSYVGEPVKLRVAHAGGAEFHVHHLHAWEEYRGAGKRVTASMLNEGQRLVGPGQGFTHTSQEGGLPTAAGEYLLHCHVPNHTQGGERLTWRVFASPQPHLAPLGERAHP
ncbi:multicopper oxidase domain-containing protein [Myxococcaceae bacterium GXIMD 01537]